MATVNLSSIITPANVLTASNAETLTNKTIAFGSNTLTDVASLATSQTITNKTINIANNTLTGVQSTLVSGTSIKTINSTSLLGSGNIALSSALTLLSTVTASSSATVDIETTFDSTYNTYALVVSNLRTSGIESIFMRMKLSGSYVTASTYYGQIEVSSSASSSYSGTTDSASPYITIIPSASAVAAAGCSFIMYITNPEVTDSRKTVGWSGVHSYNAEVIKSIGVGMNNTVGALTGLRFFPSSGTLTGTFRLYGYSKT